MNKIIKWTAIVGKILRNLSTRLRITTDLLFLWFFDFLWERGANLTEINLCRNIFNDSPVDFYILLDVKK